MSNPSFYIWVFTPSAVRSGYLAGAVLSGTEWRTELTMDEYDETEVADLMWEAVMEIEPGTTPSFNSAEEIDAPLSAALCAALNRRSQGETDEP